MTPTNKNLQDLFKTYVAKSGDEEKFRKTHVISTVDNNDRKLGPKDDQFVATTKTVERDASHHGYEAGGDEKVHSEEVNQTERDKLIAHYKADLPNILKDIRGKRKSHSDLRREYGSSWKRLANSTADEHGHDYNRDHLLAVGKQHMEDHAGQINEMSSKMKMKLGLYGKKKKMEEEVEKLDEISKATMGRYINKAAASIDLTAWRQGYKEAGAGNPSKQLEKKLSKRHKGIETAVKKLTKEDAELNEAALKRAEDRHFKKQPPKMQAAINLELRRGKDYQSAVAAARRIFKEEVEQIDELSKKTLGSYVKKASGAERPKNPMNPKSVPITTIAAYQGDSETGYFGKRFNQRSYDKAERLRKNRETGIKRAVDKMTNEEAGDDKLSTAIKKKLSDEGGAAAFKPLKDAAMKVGINLTPEMLKNMPGVSQHDDGDYILKEHLDQISEMSSKMKMKLGLYGKKKKMEEEIELDEKKLTKAELAKREEVAAAMERENPGMDMGKKMAIATAQAKKVAEEIELGEAVHSDDAFDRLEKAGAKNVKTTSGGIHYTHGGKEYSLRHNMKRTGHRTVRSAELEQHLNRLQEEVEVVEEQFAPGKFKQAMLQRGLAALQEHIVGNE